MELKRILSLFVLLITSLSPGAADSYSSGLNAYREGREPEAVNYLEKALEEDPFNDGAYLYLGILYQKSGMTAKAEEAMLTGLDLNGVYHYEITFNLANLYHRAARYDEALEQYSYLAASLSPFRTKALLNRANMGVNRKVYQEAIDDYIAYLMEVPDTPQRPNIEKMVSLLKQELQEEERKRLEEEEKLRREEDAKRLSEEEQARRLEEEARLKALEEQKRLDEEARQRALMEEILNSLSTAGEETTNFSADSEKVEEVFEESDLED